MASLQLKSPYLRLNAGIECGHASCSAQHASVSLKCDSPGPRELLFPAPQCKVPGNIRLLVDRLKIRQPTATDDMCAKSLNFSGIAFSHSELMNSRFVLALLTMML